ncbi:DBH-like monooxygenase protein 2 homolog [Folsomia candida]|uniref:DBH-like monooxygenase protein 2 homolog n=1 Tax=Folsomia candida TaxID=158441 RepID=UPI0016053D40|nr:DBH-like monooxygenase protein 2 homolog [Folsomia candida]
MQNFAKICSVLVFTFSSLSLTNSATIPTSSLLTFRNREQLDLNGKVWLAWEYDDATGLVTFEMEVETTGFVGLGISPTGGMTGADIFIAGVDPEGTAYYSDRNGQGNFEPGIDAHEDWNLISAIEAVGKTYLKFSRLADTCDEQDYPIGNDTVRLIWAYGVTDQITYHSSARRGTKSLNLIGEPIPEVDLSGTTKYEMTLDMEMPSYDTTYWCSFFKGPILPTKHHVIAFDSLLEGDAAVQHTHHFILKNCYLPPGSNQTLDEIFGDYTVDTGFLGGRCFDPEADVPIPDEYCGEDLFVWAKGGKIMTFPDNVGYPIGDGDNAGKQIYYMIEIHFDNPDEEEGIQFKTGVQFYYTDEIREHDAGQLAIGHMTNPVLTIPPNVDDFVITGHCPPEATRWGIAPETGITVFNSLLHSHISGRKLKTRHFRGNVELPWIDYDDHYDFDYQQNKPIREMQILPGDQITLECTYSSKWANGKAVVGGLSTRHEMCSTFLWHYPRQDMNQCFSETPFEKHYEDFGITKYEFVTGIGESIVMIEEPAYLAGNYRETISNFNNWTEPFIQQYGSEHRYGVHEVASYKQITGDYLVSDASYPYGYVPYVPIDVCQATTNPTEGTTPEVTTVTPEVTTPTPEVTTTTPEVTTPTPEVTTPTPEVTTPTPEVTTPTPEVTTLTPEVTTPTPEVTTPTPEVTTPTPEVTTPTPEVTTLTPEVTTPTPEVTTPTPEVTTPTPEVTTPTPEVTTPTPEVTTAQSTTNAPTTPTTTSTTSPPPTQTSTETTTASSAIARKSFNLHQFVIICLTFSIIHIY